MSNPVTREVRDIVLERCGSHCEVCGVGKPEQVHHRRPRGMGSTKRPESHYASALLALCSRCHAMIESRREMALDRGWLVRQGQDPADVPVLRYGADWVLLQSDGGVFVPPRGLGRCERCGFHVLKQGHRPGCQVVG